MTWFVAAKAVFRPSAWRSAVIHDALVILTEWIDCRGLTLHLGGELMPVDRSGMGLHGDFVGRATNWEWPESEGQ